MSDPRSARVETTKPVTLNTQNEVAPRSARSQIQSEFSYKYKYPEDLPQAPSKHDAQKETQDDEQYSSDESSSSEEEDYPEFFSNQEFLQTSSRSTGFKEGRIQIEGGSTFARREYKCNDDLVEELLESSKADQKRLTDRIDQVNSELKAI